MEKYSLIKGYSPFENQMLGFLSPEGELTNDRFKPAVTDHDLLADYKELLFSRLADLQIMSYQRQGRIYTYPPVLGQEMVSGGFSRVMEKDDWLVPYYRELPLLLNRGVTLSEVFMYFMGYEEGGRFKDAHHVLPYSVPIASQLLHAAGIGYAVKYQKKKEVVFAFIGDGGTSEGDFHEALNFASVWKVPVVFVINNNQYAISTSMSKQTGSDNFAVKGAAYGLPGIIVDGNDYLAVNYAAAKARAYALKNNQPVVIEAVTYRKGPHTTSDDPSRYRTKEEEQEWDRKDPFKRLKSYLTGKGLWDDKKDEALTEEYKEQIDDIFTKVEKEVEYAVEDVFDHVYDEKPKELERQQEEYLSFIEWKKDRH